MEQKIESFGGRDFFLNIIEEKDLLGLSSGYEDGAFRNNGLADLMFNALPEFALSYSEIESINPKNLMERLRKAVKTIYQTEKFKGRGEFGELLLHLVLQDFYGSVPAISKIYYKTGVNDTVKGFDAVHVVPMGGDTLSLWLGETKFYTSISNAISDVVKELDLHFKTDYLKNEFLLITGKIDNTWPYADKLKSLVDPKTSLDNVFERLVVPVLLTYESKTVKSHMIDSSAYKVELEKELRKYNELFKSKGLPDKIEIKLILVPIHTKKDLSTILNEKLTQLQTAL